jgi:hypothetical protein
MSHNVQFKSEFEISSGIVVRIQILPDTNWLPLPQTVVIPNNEEKRIKIEVTGGESGLKYSISFFKKTKKPTHKKKSTDTILHCSGFSEVKVGREKISNLLNFLPRILWWMKGDEDNVSVGEDVP